MCYDLNQSFEIKINGIVQGVGFRPLVYNIAKELNLTGFVRNEGDSVTVLLTTTNKGKVTEFINKIYEKLPPNAKIYQLKINISNSNITYNDFIILESKPSSIDPSVLSPDLRICSNCNSEILDKSNKRYLYPFTNCTYCGPRFSIVKSLPYDRDNTSMNEFPLCPDCEEEFKNPLDRRFHAQTTCCPSCGPHYELYDQITNTHISELNKILEYLVLSLNSGKIVFIKGLGGFHLVANPFNKEALIKVRELKQRPYKPFALMAKDINTVRSYFFLNKKEEELLTSPQSPIVLLKILHENQVDLKMISPNLNTAGVMLPYTPFHVLLFNETNCPPLLLMTSANKKDYPIVIDDAQLKENFKDRKYIVATNNRKIVNRLDDSVCKVVSDKRLIIRRARGFVPTPLNLKWNLSDRIGVGAELKNTFSIVTKNKLICSQHIGDLKSYENFMFFKEQLEYFIRLTNLRPNQIVCDLNEDFNSSHYAKELASRFGARLKMVQHHYAHALAVLAEYGLDEAISIVADGVGLGDDGTIWGCEILYVTPHDYKRLATLLPIRMPGGDAASKQPWRMAISAVYHTFQGKIPDWVYKYLKADDKSIDMIIKMLENNINSPWSSSLGRLFDALSSLLDICHYNTYEGQAAMELEEFSKQIKQKFSTNENFICYKDNLIMINSHKIILTILDLLEKGFERSYIAMIFHGILVEAIIQALIEVFNKVKIPTKDVVLSGGSMQNEILLHNLMENLIKNGFNVYIPHEYPPNDGGISVGQCLYMGE